MIIPIIAQQSKVVKEVQDQSFKGSVTAAESYRLGNELYIKNEYANALAEYQKSDQQVPNNPKVLYGMALAYKKLNNSAKAIESAKAAVTANTKYDKAYNLLGSIYMDSKKFNDAYDAYQEAAKIDSSDYKYVLSKSKAAYFGGNFDNAIGGFKKALTLKAPAAKKDEINSLLIRTYLDAGQYENVVSAYTKETLNKKNKNSSMFYGEALYRLGKKPEALAVFQGLAGQNVPSAKQWIEKIKKEK